MNGPGGARVGAGGREAWRSRVVRPPERSPTPRTPCIGFSGAVAGRCPEPLAFVWLLRRWCGQMPPPGTDEVPADMLECCLSSSAIKCSRLMIICIPLGGTGQRFKECAYTTPKALIKALGKPILFWLLDSILQNRPDDLSTFLIPYHQEYVSYRIEDLLRKHYPQVPFIFHCLKSSTRGAVETVSQSLTSLLHTEDQPLVLMDGDNFYTCDVLSKWNRLNQICVFHESSQSAAYSFALVDGNHLRSIVEKERVSDLACSGFYGFQSFSDLSQACSELLKSGCTQKGEFYTSGVIQALICSGSSFGVFEVEPQEVVCLGTPLQLRLFCNSLPAVSAESGSRMITQRRYCFDLDNTLVTFPEVPGDYTTVLPIQAAIDFVTYLKSFGHTIIIYTARRMRTHNGDLGKVVADIGIVTLETLARFKIPYDEIYFGKPEADAYIDDLAVCAHSDIAKELGFYAETLPTRSFNFLSSDGPGLFVKSGSDLRGEIHWYKHIPADIKDMFPIAVSFSDDHSSYTMERVYGVPLSRLLVDGMLTTDLLHVVTRTMMRLHSLPVNDVESLKGLDIYANYAQKMTERWNLYESLYSRVGAGQKFAESVRFLEEYAANDHGRLTLVHGDPVFTNIILNSFGKLKLIDMRGRLGDVMTIYGDCFYDWAKVLQSLVGYDSVLLCRAQCPSNMHSLVLEFKTFFIRTFDVASWQRLQMLTQSLILSLLPLHDDDYRVPLMALVDSPFLTDF
jgi:capsule biosynthesis phosphatase